VTSYPVVEHGEGRLSRWVRERRIRLALLVGLVESLLIVFGDLSWFWAVLFAAGVFAFYFLVGRRTRYVAVRELSWVAALSQTLPVLIPVAVAIAGFILLVGVVVVALFVLALLLLGRR
jgi:hypothetical protein